MEEIEKLIEKELKLEGVDQESKNKIITELGEVILERVLTIVLAKDETGQMERLIEEGKLGEAFEYAEQNFPYLEEILEATASEVILEFTTAA